MKVVGGFFFRAERGREGHLGLLRHARVSLKWAMVVGSILFLALYLPNTGSGRG